MSVFSSAWRFAAVPVVLMVAAPASAQLLQRKDLSYPMALTIATGALEDCKAKGYAVSVVVVDRGGDVMVALRANDAGPHTMENARRKAYTARTFGRSTLEWRDSTEPGKENFGQPQLADVIPLGGGYPIRVGNDTIGGVGVSGNNQAGDEGCAKAGVDKVADQLK